MAMSRPTFLVPLNVVVPDDVELFPPQAAATSRAALAAAAAHRICARQNEIKILSSWVPFSLCAVCRANARLPGCLGIDASGARSRCRAWYHRGAARV